MSRSSRAPKAAKRSKTAKQPRTAKRARTQGPRPPVPARPRGAGVYPFNIRVHVRRHKEQISADSQITVLDGWDNVKMTGHGTVSLTLPSGLYPVRVERGGEMFEKVIRHTGETSEELEEPLRSSAVPTFDTVESHEYYSYTAKDWSTQDTGAAAACFKAPRGSPRVFIFVRAASEELERNKDLAKDLKLLRADGSVVTEFDASVVVQNRLEGWLAFSAPAQPGWYVLSHETEGRREMPLHVFPNWDSQLFLPFDRRPQLEGASFLLTPLKKGFDPEDRLTTALDAALNGLRSGLDLLPHNLQQELLYGKFDNPMVGLIGAYSLLRDPAAKKETVDIVTGNLNRLLPGSPDVAALKIMAAQRFGRPIKAAPVLFPPMVRMGLEAVIRASAQVPELIPENGLIDEIVFRVVRGSVWSQWERPAASTRHGGLEGLALDADNAADEVPHWVVDLVSDEARRSERKIDALNLHKLALDVGLPLRTLQMAARRSGPRAT
jgi:hypothetical protein